MRNILITWLSLVVFSPAAWGMAPKVTRWSSSERIAPECAVRIRLEVEFPENAVLPNAWLLSESWPRGWHLEDACWNEQPYAPMKQGGNATTCYWLFDGETTPPVGNGILTYTLRAPESLSRSGTMNSAEGAAYTYNDIGFVQGTMTLIPDEASQPQYFKWTLQPGWSLMALPCELDAASRDLLESLGDGFFQAIGSQESYCQGNVPPVGVPFWLYRNATEPIDITLAPLFITDMPEPLRAAGTVRHQQWNLFGVCGENPVRLAAGVRAWRWRNGKYVRCEEKAVLQPGEAVWIFVE